MLGMDQIRTGGTDWTDEIEEIRKEPEYGRKYIETAADPEIF